MGAGLAVSMWVAAGFVLGNFKYDESVFKMLVGKVKVVEFTVKSVQEYVSYQSD
jgi:hypothetical protein